jgi:hypothetical protein
MAFAKTWAFLHLSPDAVMLADTPRLRQLLAIALEGLRCLGATQWQRFGHSDLDKVNPA